MLQSGTAHQSIGVGMPETKKQKFKRLKSARLIKLEKNLELLSNLGNKQNYEFSDDDIKDMRKDIFDLFKKYDKRLLGKEFKL